MFIVPKPEGDKKENRFEFKIGTGKHSIPFLQFLGGNASEYLEANSHRSEVALMRQLIAIESPSAESDIRSLSNDQMQALSAAWVEASTADAAEKSSASDDSE